MSAKSNDFGRAYEFAWMQVLEDVLSVLRPIKVIQNSSYEANKAAWEGLDESQQALYLTSAKAAVREIIELEPLMEERDESQMTLEFQTDDHGETGDVRDIVIKRQNIEWEIGLSIKHNHEALKHSRLSSKIDFGAKWFGISCSEAYWASVNPIFDKLKKYKAQKVKWKDLADKEQIVYVPLLDAFKAEVMRAYSQDANLPKKMVEFLLGLYDYHKVVSFDAKHLTLLQTFNLHGTLNQPSKTRIAAITIPVVELPTRLVALDFKQGSQTTIEMYLDNGWQLSFRIHNASTNVETSLKFDIQFIGMPTTIQTFECKWY